MVTIFAELNGQPHSSLYTRMLRSRLMKDSGRLGQNMQYREPLQQGAMTCMQAASCQVLRNCSILGCWTQRQRSQEQRTAGSSLLANRVQGSRLPTPDGMNVFAQAQVCE